MEMRMQRSIEILLVDDSPEDQELTREAFDDAKIENNLHAVGDGVEALSYLRKTGKYENFPTPDLILLDLNMPKKDGREVLAEIKSDDRLKHLPVIILTTSKDDEDILESYKHYANCYVSKPLDFSSFEEIVRSIESFWLSIVILPKAKL